MGDKPVFPVLIGPFSGPVHGVCVINNALRALMEQRGLHPVIIDLSPGTWRGIGYHAVRAGRAAWGALRMLGAAAQGRHLRHIMSLDGGGGLAYNMLLVLAARFTGQALLFYHHSSRYVLADSRMMRMLLAVAGPVPQVFCSRTMAQLFLDRYQPGAETFIVNNAAWIYPVTATHAGHAGGPRLGFLSALSLEKGVGRAIETLRALRSRGVPAELALAGATGDPAVRGLLDKAGEEFGPVLSFHGVVQGSRKDAFLAGLDYFLFPSLYSHETQSLVVPEALSAGVPVIAHDHRFVAEVVGEGGLLVPSSDDYAARAADWIIAGQGALGERRASASRQFARERQEAAGQVERLIAWSAADK
jgi:glycosyltransferase involved in cell wall biosynthesis